MKTLRNLGLIALATAGVLSLGGCAIELRPPVSVYSVPSASVDWWYDGGNYYYFDGGAGLYFYYGPNAEVIWCGRGWAPRAEWRGIGHPAHFPVYRGGRPARGGWGGSRWYGPHHWQ